MSKSDIKNKFDEIVAFAEIEKFLDTPVKRYSSGMYVRLAFSVAAHLETDILLVDEVLAVGDIQFQKKCLGKMGAVAQNGRTVLFVSHNMLAVQSLCEKGIFLDAAQIKYQGSMEEAIKRYIESFQDVVSIDISQRKDREGDGKLLFTKIEFLNASYNPVDSFISGEKAIIVLHYEIKEEDVSNSVEVAIAIIDSWGSQLTVAANSFSQDPFDGISPKGKFVCEIPRLNLVSGQYFLNVICRINGAIADWVQKTAVFNVEKGDFYGTGRNADSEQSKFLMDYEWKILAQQNI